MCRYWEGIPFSSSFTGTITNLMPHYSPSSSSWKLCCVVSCVLAKVWNCGSGCFHDTALARRFKPFQLRASRVRFRTTETAGNGVVRA
jgi:hypothetical protein